MEDGADMSLVQGLKARGGWVVDTTSWASKNTEAKEAATRRSSQKSELGPEVPLPGIATATDEINIATCSLRGHSRDLYLEPWPHQFWDSFPSC